METWGELFWDAWIRFRLWCRSLWRTCWPPRIEAWQVCTVTGVAAIVLTLLSIRTPRPAAGVAAVDGKSANLLAAAAQSPDELASTPRSQRKLASTPAVDPYDVSGATDEAVPVDEEIALDESAGDPSSSPLMADSEPGDEFVDVSSPPAQNSRRAPRLQSRTAAADLPDQEPGQGQEVAFGESGLSTVELDATPEMAADEAGSAAGTGQFDDSEFEAPKTRVPDAENLEVVPRRKLPTIPAEDDAELAVDDAANEPVSPPGRRTQSRELALDPTSTEPVAKPSVDEFKPTTSEDSEVTEPPAATAGLRPSRDRGHYTRPDHEHEEEGHDRQEMPVARAKKIEFTPPTPPAKAIVRSGNHYRRFGDDEDQESDSSEEIQPRTVQSTVPPVTGPVPPDVPAAEVDVPEPAESLKMDSEDGEENELPPVPKIQRRTAVPMPEANEIVVDFEPEMDEGPHPPIAFAPEPDLTEIANSPSSNESPDSRDFSKDFHGPARSTESSDHEAHLDEDVFVRGKRKQPIKMKLPVGRPADQAVAGQDSEPATAKLDYHGPVRSTESADHEGHMDEDDLQVGKRKPLTARVVPDAAAETTRPELPLPEASEDSELPLNVPIAQDPEIVVSTEDPKREFHGPVLSTESADHEAHLDEDVLLREKRKRPVMSEVPFVKRRDYHGPVLSTDATDHETHVEEDGYGRGQGSERQNWPVPKTVRKTPEHLTQQPVAVEEPELPVVDQDAKPIDVPIEVEAPAEMEPVEMETVEPDPAGAAKPIETSGRTVPPTTPRTEPRTTPRVIRHDEEEYDSAPPPLRRRAVEEVAPSESELPDGPLSIEQPLPARNDKPEMPEREEAEPDVAPVVDELTQPRGPARITIPGSVEQPEEVPGVPPRSLPQDPVVRPTAPRVTTAPKLVMNISGPRVVPVGTQVVMHFKITNQGTAPATGITVTDVLPPGLQHRLSADLEYTIDRLAPGESRETNLTVQCTAPGVITNRAVLTADGDLTTEASIQFEATGGGNSSTSSGPATRSPVTLTHRGPERWLVDSTGQFLVTVTNISGKRLKSVTVTETYPLETNLLHATVGNKVDATNRTVSWTINDFAPGASYILETELHSTKSGRQTTLVKVKVDGVDVAEDRWTAVSYPDAVTR